MRLWASVSPQLLELTRVCCCTDRGACVSSSPKPLLPKQRRDLYLPDESGLDLLENARIDVRSG